MSDSERLKPLFEVPSTEESRRRETVLGCWRLIEQTGKESILVAGGDKSTRASRAELQTLRTLLNHVLETLKWIEAYQYRRATPVNSLGRAGAGSFGVVCCYCLFFKETGHSDVCPAERRKRQIRETLGSHTSSLA